MKTLTQVSCQRSRFHLDPEVAYINCSYMGPLLKSVEKAATAALHQRHNPANIKPSDFFEPPHEVRRAFAKLVDVKDPKRIAILGSTSYGIAIVAKNVPVSAGDRILILEEQFPSNTYSWQKLSEEKGAFLDIVSPPGGQLDRGAKWNEKILDSIQARTKVVAMPHVHWTDGTLFDLKAIRKRCDEVGALLIIDGTQSVGALPFSVEDIQPDALICSGYKWLLGPYGIALGYFGEYFDQGEPLEENWKNRYNSEDFAGLVKFEPRYQPGVLRYDVGGGSNFIYIQMLKAALGFLLEIGPENIQSYCERLTEEPLNELRTLGCRIEDDRFRGKHLFGIRVPGDIDPKELKVQFDKANVNVSVRGDAVRIGPNVYNDATDMDRLVTCFREVVG